MTGTCPYTHDISSDRFDDLPGETWACPHETRRDGEACVFHAEFDQVDDGVLRDRLRSAIRAEPGPVRLLGATLGSLDLDYAVLDGPSNHPLDLREATVNGTFSARHGSIQLPLLLQGSRLRGEVTLEDTTLARRVDFRGAVFEERVSLRMADFESWLDFGATEFQGPVYARVARFRRGIYGVDAVFESAADFLNTRFDDVANFYRATFRGGAVFDSSTFLANAQFIEATFDGPARKLQSESGSPRSPPETLDGVALSMHSVTCERDFRLSDAELSGDVDFAGSDLGRALQTDGLSASESNIVVDCTGTRHVTGSIDGDGSRIRYDMTDAEVGEVTLVGESGFEVFRFDSTTFDGFDFSAYKHELAVNDWRLHGAESDQTPEALENLYLRAKNGANEIGDNRAASEFFIREMDHVRSGHWERATAFSSFGETVRSGASWFSNSCLKVSCGYGERPLRPVFFSTGIVLLFAAVYGVLDAPITYAKPLGFVVFSIVSFVSIILGLPEAAGTVLSFVIALEAFIGGFTIALFVFTLTRSISR